MPFCDWVHVFVSVCDLPELAKGKRYELLKQAFEGINKAPFLINNVMVGEVTITPTDNNDCSFVVKYNYDKLCEVMPIDMAKAIVASDSEVYYLSDYC